MLPVRNAGVGASAADTSLPGLEAGVLGQGAGGRRARGRCFLSAHGRPLPCCPRRRAVSSGFPVSPRLISTPSIVGHLPAPHPHQDVPKAQHHSKATLPNAVPSGLGLQHTDPGGHTRSVRDVLSTLQHISALVLRWRGWPGPACDDPLHRPCAEQEATSFLQRQSPGRPPPHLLRTQPSGPRASLPSLPTRLLGASWPLPLCPLRSALRRSWPLGFCLSSAGRTSGGLTTSQPALGSEFSSQGIIACSPRLGTLIPPNH